MHKRSDNIDLAVCDLLLLLLRRGVAQSPQPQGAEQQQLPGSVTINQYSESNTKQRGPHTRFQIPVLLAFLRLSFVSNKTTSLLTTRCSVIPVAFGTIVLEESDVSA